MRKNKLNWDNLQVHGVELLSRYYYNFKQRAEKEQNPWFQEKVKILHDALKKKGQIFVPGKFDSMGRFRKGHFRRYK